MLISTTPGLVKAKLLILLIAFTSSLSLNAEDYQWLEGIWIEDFEATKSRNDPALFANDETLAQTEKLVLTIKNGFIRGSLRQDSDLSYTYSPISQTKAIIYTQNGVQTIAEKTSHGFCVIRDYEDENSLGLEEGFTLCFERLNA